MTLLRSIISIIFLLLSTSLFAIQAEHIPNQFSIKSRACETICFDAVNQQTNEIIGSLVPSNEYKGTYLLQDAEGKTNLILRVIIK